MTVSLYNGDCLSHMRTMPDKSVDLCLCDPPYGIEWKPSTLFGKATPQTKALKELQSWDKRPDKEIFDEIKRVSNNWIIKRVSNNWIIWGGNYFADYLGACREPLIWDKKTGANNYADGEMAFTSFQGTLRIIHHQWCGVFKDSERGEQNVHPTQKPKFIMGYCLEKYTTEGMTIFDPFMGSGTTGVACVQLERNFIGCEISKDYFNIAKERIEEAQNTLFTMGGQPDKPTVDLQTSMLPELSSCKGKN